MRAAKILTLILFGVVGCSCFAQSNLEKFTKCDLGSDFQIVQVDRLPHDPMIRTVETPSGSKEVVMTDGYRVLITYKESEPFVNLKAEQFEKARYATDKQTLISSLENSAKGTPNMASAKPERVKLGLFDAYGINRKALEGGVLSTYILFDDSGAQTLTAYILNDEPEYRKFQVMGEYEKIETTSSRSLATVLTKLRASSLGGTKTRVLINSKFTPQKCSGEVTPATPYRRAGCLTRPLLRPVLTQSEGWRGGFAAVRFRSSKAASSRHTS